MRSIAKRGIPGMPAPAERNRCSPAQAKFLAVLIDNREVAFHAQRAIIQDRDFCSSQGFLRLQHPMRVLVMFQR
jgi:hypothetical protein